MPETPKNGKRAPKRLPVTLTPEETAALLATINTRCTTGLRNRVMLQVMLGAGLRVSEVCALRGVDVDPQEGTIRVNLGKGGKDRVVPVDGETAGWLRAWAEKRQALGANGRAPFFFGLREGATGRGDRRRHEGLKPRYLQALVARLAEAAGIEKRVSPHVLRHTYATEMLKRPGATLEHVRRLLGHANVQTTQVYLHVNDEDLRRLVQGEPEAEAPIDPQVQAVAEALAGLTEEQRTALVALLGGPGAKQQCR